MNPRGKKIYVLGDSLSLPGQPFAEMAKKLEDAGGLVTVDAQGGHAIWEIGLNKPLNPMVRAFKRAVAADPDLFILAMGTNDYAANNAAIGKGLEKILDAFRGRTIVMGPPYFAPGVRGANGQEIAPGTDKVYQMLRLYFPMTIDTRPLTAEFTAKGDRDRAGIHFRGTAGKRAGEKLAKVLLGELPREGQKRRPPGQSSLVLLGMLLAILYGASKRR